MEGKCGVAISRSSLPEGTNTGALFKVSLHCDATLGQRYDNQEGETATLARLITDCHGESVMDVTQRISAFSRFALPLLQFKY